MGLHGDARTRFSVVGNLKLLARMLFVDGTYPGTDGGHTRVEVGAHRTWPNTRVHLNPCTHTLSGSKMVPPSSGTARRVVSAQVLQASRSDWGGGAGEDEDEGEG